MHQYPLLWLIVYCIFLTILNLYGQRTVLPVSSHTLQVTHLPAGVYLLDILTPTTRHTFKVVKL